MASLRYSVGLESSLPCSKSDLRACLMTAIRAARDVEARAKLCSGYVRLEVFVTNAEFEAVRDFEDVERTPPSLRHADSSRALRRPAARPATGPDPMAILARVAALMLLRRQELGGCC